MHEIWQFRICRSTNYYYSFMPSDRCFAIASWVRNGSGILGDGSEMAIPQGSALSAIAQQSRFHEGSGSSSHCVEQNVSSIDSRAAAPRSISDIRRESQSMRIESPTTCVATLLPEFHVLLPSAEHFKMCDTRARSCSLSWQSPTRALSQRIPTDSSRLTSR